MDIVGRNYVAETVANRTVSKDCRRCTYRERGESRKRATHKVEQDLNTLIQEQMNPHWIQDVTLGVNAVTLQPSTGPPPPEENDITRYCEE